MAKVELLFRGPNGENMASRVVQLYENAWPIWSTQEDIDWPGWKRENNSDIELLVCVCACVCVKACSQTFSRS